MGNIQMSYYSPIAKYCPSSKLERIKVVFPKKEINPSQSFAVGVHDNSAVSIIETVIKL
jgi:hypothetical protein